MVQLWGRECTRSELLTRVGRLEQVAEVELCEASEGVERGARVLRSTTGSGFSFEVLVDRGFDVGRAWHGGRPPGWWSPVGMPHPGFTTHPELNGSVAFLADWSAPAGSTTHYWVAPTRASISTTRTAAPRRTGCTAATPAYPARLAGYRGHMDRRRMRLVGGE